MDTNIGSKKNAASILYEFINSAHSAGAKTITADDITLMKSDAEDADKALFAELHCRDGQWLPLRLRIKNKALYNKIGESILLNFGPPHAVIRFCEHYGKETGPGVWIVSFHATSILAVRDFVMDQIEFAKVFQAIGH